MDFYSSFCGMASCNHCSANAVPEADVSSTARRPLAVSLSDILLKDATKKNLENLRDLVDCERQMSGTSNYNNAVLACSLRCFQVKGKSKPIEPKGVFEFQEGLDDFVRAFDAGFPNAMGSEQGDSRQFHRDVQTMRHFMSLFPISKENDMSAPFKAGAKGVPIKFNRGQAFLDALESLDDNDVMDEMGDERRIAMMMVIHRVVIAVCHAEARLLMDFYKRVAGRCCPGGQHLEKLLFLHTHFRPCDACRTFAMAIFGTAASTRPLVISYTDEWEFTGQDAYDDRNRDQSMHNGAGVMIATYLRQVYGHNAFWSAVKNKAPLCGHKPSTEERDVRCTVYFTRLL